MSAQEAEEIEGWADPDLVVYHGTSLQNAHRIEASGVDLTMSRPGTDFGRGFYVTTNLAQAQAWAIKKAKSTDGSPAIVSYKLRRHDLAQLESLWFVCPTDDYWRFVDHCWGDIPNGTIPNHSRRANLPCYDIVIGPVSMGFGMRRSAYRDYDQVSFHTDAALQLLNVPKILDLSAKD